MILTKEAFLEHEAFYVDEVMAGKVFIYPTDTIYGLGCDASNGAAAKKIREIKQRDGKPFSVIVPGKEWIRTYCDVPDFGEEHLEKLPGKYTLILKLKEKSDLAKDALVGEAETIGVRIPDNWFSEFLSRHNLMFVTTSVNISGQKPITRIEELDTDFSDKVDYVIDDGVLDGRPSTLVDLSKDDVQVMKR